MTVVKTLIAIGFILGFLPALVGIFSWASRKQRAPADMLWPGSDADRWPQGSPCTPEWPCSPEDGWICTTHVAEGISRVESWANHD